MSKRQVQYDDGEWARAYDVVSTPDEARLARHVYEGERCVYCNVNTYDDAIYGPFSCVTREPIAYMTETP